MRNIFSTKIQYFNSHPHEEDDQALQCIYSFFLYFNSHPHEEDDDLPCAISSALLNFNSHPHEEDDSNFKQK